MSVDDDVSVEVLGAEPPARLVERCVTPYYLAMMGRCAPRVPDHVLDEVAALARAASDDDVVALLRGHWRPQVMGGWLAAGRTSPAVVAAVHAALRTSIGSLTAPVLATAAVLAAPRGAAGPAVDALVAYHGLASADPTYGAEGFVAAAVERLGGRAPGRSDTADRACLDAMLDVGRRLGAPRS